MPSKLLETRIVFFGTPAFALPALEALVAADVPLVGIVTKPDKPAGRGHLVSALPVKRWAEARGITVCQPPGLKKPANRTFLEALKPDLLVVVAYGKILPREVLDIPRCGAVNVHASLLPRHRGPSPIQAAILAGDVETGVTIMLLDEGMDTGPILAQERVAIASDNTGGLLGEKLALVGARLLTPTLERWLEGTLFPTPQEDQAASVCRMMTKDDGRIDWTKSAAEIERMIRAYTPWPGAWTTWRVAKGRVERRLRIHRAQVSLQTPPSASKPVAGTVRSLGSGVVAVDCGGTSFLHLELVQPQDRPVMPASAFFRGHTEVLATGLGVSRVPVS